MSGTPPMFHLLLPNQLARSHDHQTNWPPRLRTDTAHDIVTSVIGGDRSADDRAQQAVAEAILHDLRP